MWLSLYLLQGRSQETVPPEVLVYFHLFYYFNICCANLKYAFVLRKIQVVTDVKLDASMREAKAYVGLNIPKQHNISMSLFFFFLADVLNDTLPDSSETAINPPVI